MASKPDSPFILVDGSSYLFRAFHALPELINAQGQQTGAIYGVLNMLRKLVDTYQPKYMAVVFDAKGKTFRDELYPQYKAQRPPMPDELSSQVPPLLELVSASGLPMLQVPGVEADDVIGTLAAQAAEAGWKTVISTGDKDLAQLVNEQVSLINTMSDSVMDDQGVADKFGVAPEQIIDFLSLVGDSADNIPGIPKVGPKTAAKWLSQYGSLDELVAHAGDVKGKVGENLRAHLDQLPLSKELATIRCDLELGVDLYDLSVKPPELDTLRSWFERLEFMNEASECFTLCVGIRQGRCRSERCDYGPSDKKLSDSHRSLSGIVHGVHAEVPEAMKEWEMESGGCVVSIEEGN